MWSVRASHEQPLQLRAPCGAARPSLVVHRRLLQPAGCVALTTALAGELVSEKPAAKRAEELDEAATTAWEWDAVADAAAYEANDFIMPLTPASKVDRLMERSEVPVLLFFSAPWCGPCKMLVPRVQEIGKSLRKSLRIVKVDIKQHPEVAAHYKISALPTLMLFIKGRSVETMTGLQKKPQILDRLRFWLNQQS